MLDKILEIIDKLGPLFYIIVPAIFGVYYNTREKVRDKEKEIIKKNKEKAQAKYEVWEHEESRRVIKKIKDMCNYYKDKGHMDLVQYLQLENGTVATSKLCNMFISCLAEDSRFGSIPKLITKLQRVPYSRLTSWVEKLQEYRDDQANYYIIRTTDELVNHDIIGAMDKIKSSISAPVYDPNELLIGIVVFHYSKENLNNQPEKQAEILISQFQNSIEAIFLNYHLDRIKKKIELGLDSEEEEE